MASNKWKVLTVAAGVALVACTATPPAEETARRLTLEPCTFPGLDEELLCGTLAVYEDREARQGRMIDLNVVVAPALGESPEPDPVFYFAGGPGAAAAENVVDMMHELGPARQRRDVVLIDQRGTGGSHPLRCEAPGSPEDLQGYFEPFLAPDVVRACRQELEKKADLTLYTSSIAMDDVDEVRSRLGYEKINAFGSSYGTRAIQIYMRRHPERVRTALLQGVGAMHQHLPLYHARDADRAMDLLLDACAQEEACAAAFPNLRAELRAVIERLQEAPAEVTIPHPESGESVTITMGRDAFASSLRFLNYGDSTARLLPVIIHLAYEEDYELPARTALFLQMMLRKLLYFGMHLSVCCAEDAPFFTREEAAEATADTILGDYRVRQMLDACALWPRGEIPEDYHEPVTVAVPTLLISGRLDPVTPPSWADQVAAHLPHSIHLVFDHGHHNTGDLTNLDCLQDLFDQLLAAGSVEGLDTSCLENTIRPPFFTEKAVVEALLDRVMGQSGPEEEPPAEEG